MSENGKPSEDMVLLSEATRDQLIEELTNAFETIIFKATFEGRDGLNETSILKGEMNDIITLSSEIQDSILETVVAATLEFAKNNPGIDLDTLMDEDEDEDGQE